MTEKKLYKTMFEIILIISCAGAIGAAVVYDTEQEKYVVTAKAANKIIYRPVVKPYSQHVMTFGSEPDSKNIYYPYINIGDTISGLKHYMDKRVTESWNFDRGPMIKSVNGRNLQELREIARLDSLVRQIKSNQR